MPSKTKFIKNNKIKMKKNPIIKTTILAVMGLFLILITIYDLLLNGIGYFTYIVGTISIIMVIIALFRTFKILFSKEK